MEPKGTKRHRTYFSDMASPGKRRGSFYRPFGEEGKRGVSKIHSKQEWKKGRKDQGEKGRRMVEGKRRASPFA